MTDAPVTVLMAVYNGSAFLPIAIDSILEQTYPAFKFLIVDDASTDDTREVIRAYEDNRIELICLEENVGQTAALNAGLQHASTKWIARMDADDYSAPTRLEEQMQALDADASLRCLGTFAWIFHDDPEDEDGVVTTPETYEDIQRILVGSPIIHGTIMISREALLEVGGYTGRYRYCADIEMYDRFLPKYKAAVIPRKLLGVRRHVGQGSNTRVAFDEAIEISLNRLANFDYPAKDSAVVRASLSRAYLARTRHLAKEKRFLSIPKDILSALKVSPKSFLYDCFIAYVVYNVPERVRTNIWRLIDAAPPPLRIPFKRASRQYYKSE